MGNSSSSSKKSPISPKEKVKPLEKEEGCAFIVTRGERSGQRCGKKVVLQSLCERHYAYNPEPRRGYIYLSRFQLLNTKNELFKIGLSENTSRPFDHGEPVLITACADIVRAENMLMRILSIKCSKEKDEYFFGLEEFEFRRIVNGVVGLINEDSYDRRDWVTLISEQLDKMKMDVNDLSKHGRGTKEDVKKAKEDSLNEFINACCSSDCQPDVEGKPANMHSVLSSGYKKWCLDHRAVFSKTQFDLFFRNQEHDLVKGRKLYKKYYLITN